MILQSLEVLSPVRLLERAAAAFAGRVAVVDGDLSLTYAEFAARSERLTGALARAGVGAGDRVAALCANSHVMLELHHGVPMRGAVLVPLNTRLAEPELVHILDHAGAGLLVVTAEFADLGARLARRCGITVLTADGPGSDYEEALERGEPAVDNVGDERALLSINYTSGTTGQPKGVMYHHRGAYLQAVAMSYHLGLRPGSRYLWTLPMFHCHGWCIPWAVTAVGGTHVCQRSIEVGQIWQHLRTGVTHFSAAPTVLTMIAEHPAAREGACEQPVEVSTGGAPPSPTLLRAMSELNMRVTHLYGLTETFGPVIVNQWQPEWDGLDEDARARMQSRQGVPNLIASPVRVVDGAGRDVAADGEQMGELVVRGNDLMLGYYRDDAATAAASLDGWFRTGDLAVMHPDGYVEIRDRLKDVIISGGENIASVEVERAIDSHPDVVESAVVGVPDERWGQVPVAYVTVRQGSDVTPTDIIAHVRSQLAGYKAPKAVTFVDLPHTSTGKIQKNLLRESR